MKTDLIQGLPAKEYHRQWRAAHKENVRKAGLAYKKRHPEKWNTMHLESVRKWSKKNPEKVRAYQLKATRTYYKKNRERRVAESIAYDKKHIDNKRVRRRRHYWKNRDKIRASTKLKRIANPERFRIVDRARYARDPEKRQHQSLVQRAKRSGISCYLSLKEWKALLSEHNFLCFYCKCALTKTNRSLDHKTPLVRGGTNDKENLVPSCIRCNQRKNTKTSEEFLKTNFQ